jgi:hypothetical protein
MRVGEGDGFGSAVGSSVGLGGDRLRGFARERLSKLHPHIIAVAHESNRESPSMSNTMTIEGSPHTESVNNGKLTAG